MASLLRFGRKKKSSEQLVKSVRELLGVIAEADADPKLKEKVRASTPGLAVGHAMLGPRRRRRTSRTTLVQ